MMRRMITLVSVLGLTFSLASPVNATLDIIWVSDGSNGPGTESDRGWVELLETHGYNVQRIDRTLRGDFDPGELDTLNAADLLIVSRDTNSGEYNKADQWNSITTPTILLSSHLAGSDRWNWLDSESIATLDPPVVMEIMAPGNPLLDGMNIEMYTGQVNLLETSDPGNGMLIARLVQSEPDNWVGIVYWEAGAEFYPGSGQTAGGSRLLFVAGTAGEQGSGQIGRYNLTDYAEPLFLNAVANLVPEPATMVLLGFGGLILLRRRD